MREKNKRLLTIALALFVLQIGAQTASAQSNTVTLDLKDVTVGQALE